jgi:GntR family transcriptional repressor for pyruvate dehydrogenase complex
MEEYTVGFNIIKKDNLSDTIAESIENDILSGELKLGDKLPSENRLSEMFGVSRNVIREALRLVKERGLVEISTGSGIYVSSPKAAIIGRNLNRMVAVNNYLLSDFFDMRMTLETKASRMAAVNITDEELAKLERTINIMKEMSDNSVAFGEAENKFHYVVARASRNDFLRIFIDSLMDAQAVYTTEELDGKYCREIVHDHEKIYYALKHHKEAEAERCMAQHVANAYEWMQKVKADKNEHNKKSGDRA